MDSMILMALEELYDMSAPLVVASTRPYVATEDHF
jgi:hypothetical protein